MRKELWLLSALSTIILILICILIFIPSPQRVSQEGIEINLQENQEISSPLEITGQVSGNGWSGFEGQVGTVKLLDSNGNEIVSGILTATTEWTNLPTNFKTTLVFDAAPGNVILVFNNENPSGDPSKDKTLVLPVKIKASSETTEVKIFFGNPNLSSQYPSDECHEVYGVYRYIPKTTAVAKAAIEELLKGPTDFEKSGGVFTSIPAGSKLNSISINNGVALVDFNETTESGGGSCSMTSRVAQIKATLMEFPTIKNIIISINGRTTDIFQP